MFENDENTKFEKKQTSDRSSKKKQQRKKSKNLFINKTHLLQLNNAKY